MKKMYFAVNLVAGRGLIAKKLGNIIEKFTKSGYEVTVHTTISAIDTAKAARYACENGYDLLVCAGGDGTLSQCLQGIMESENRIPIGYIPAGSTNDFARSLDIPKDPIKAAEFIIKGKPVYCDIGGLNKEYFSYVAAFGAFTDVTYETPQKAKNVLGPAAYFLNGLMHMTNVRAKRMRIEYNGHVIEDEFLFGMVTNAVSIAGLFSLNNLMLDDGVFEVTLIKKPENAGELQDIVHAMVTEKGKKRNSNVITFRTNKITFTSLNKEAVTWTRDGEYGGDSEINTVVNYNKAVRFVVCRNKKSKFFADH